MELVAVDILKDFYIGDAGGEGSRFVEGQMNELVEKDVADLLIKLGAARPSKPVNKPVKHGI